MKFASPPVSELPTEITVPLNLFPIQNYALPQSLQKSL